MSVDEIRMIQGEFVFIRDGKVEPLHFPQLQSLLLKNAENFIAGSITLERHEEIYSQVLEIEQAARAKQAMKMAG